MNMLSCGKIEIFYANINGIGKQKLEKVPQMKFTHIACCNTYHYKVVLIFIYSSVSMWRLVSDVTVTGGK